MNIIYPYTIYLDRGRLPKRGKYGKISGWEQVRNRVIKVLERIPSWSSGEEEYPGKLLPANSKATDSKGFCENSGLGKGISGKTSGFIRETYSRIERVW
jgi:hypothetical protein